MYNLSPIILFVYNRPEHTKQTVESLLQCKLANESVLYIFSDAPKTDEQKSKVDQVRKYIRSITGFKEIIIEESSVNKGLANSVIYGVSKIFESHESVIVLEDDLIFSTQFLAFMNSALNLYKSKENIFSVSGYTFPIDFPEDYKGDVFLSRRASSWGWGTWKNRWKYVDWKIKKFEETFANKRMKEKFNNAGEDLSIMLVKQLRGEINSWAIRWSFHHFINNGFCLYPSHSRVKNIGMDNSGVHSKTSKKFDVQVSEENFKLILDVKFNENIERNIKCFFKQSFLRKLINYIKYSV